MGNDDQVWREYAAKVKRVAGKKKREPSSSSPLEGEVRWGAQQKRSSALVAPPSQPPPQGGRSSKFFPVSTIFDRRVERQLRHGDIRIDAKLDLHGMTQAVAHEALTQFMAQHIKRGSRKLLIVTGKGRGNAGVLKSSLRGWLSDLPRADRIIDLRPAAVKHGGDGAFYVWLKKVASR